MNKRILISLLSFLCTMSAMAQVDEFSPLQKDLEYVGIDYLKDEAKAKSIGLPHAYSGKGVLVAVIDMPYNFCNMAFIDPLTGQQRTKYLYDPDENVLYQSPDAIASKSENETYGHGMHVSAIAVGHYPDSLNYLDGIATSSDIMFCYENRSSFFYDEQLHVIDSIATSLNVPCVVNLSKNSYSYGLFVKDNPYIEQFEKFTNKGKTPGRIMCISSSNRGDTDGKEVIKYKFTSDNDTLRILTDCFYSPNYKYNSAKDIELLCTDVESTKVNAEIYNVAKRCKVDNFTLYLKQTPITSISDVLSDVSYGVNIYNEHFISVGLESYTANEDNLALSYIITGKKDESVTVEPQSVNSIVPDGYTTFNTTLPFRGIDLYCLTPAVLTVGSVSAKDCVDPANKQFGKVSKGQIAHDSAWGEVDGLIYPDVCAPGVCILSPSDKDKTGTDYQIVDNGQTYGFFYSSGTSLSNPMMTGVVALMLEQDPTLTVERIRTLLYQTNDVTEQCYNDKKMLIGGHGILNAPKLMKALIAEQTGITPVNVSRDYDTPYYDIMGRIVDPKVYHGIIIKNGRKYIN